MWYQVERFLSPLFRQLSLLEREHWIFIFVGALVVGFLSMRGFGSRTKY